MRTWITLVFILLSAKALHAQNKLVTHQYIRNKVTEKVYTQKTGTAIPNDNISINATNAKNWLVLEERFLPAQTGKMPWDTEIVPMITHLACHGRNAVAVCNPGVDVYGSCGTYLYSSFDPNMQTFNRQRIAATGSFWNSASAIPCSPAPAGQQLMATGDSTSTTMNLLSTTAFTGPLNRCGVWSCNTDTLGLNSWAYTRGKFYAPQAGTYYIGLAADNFFRLQIDGVAFVRNDLNPLTEESFKIWHIFPITLTAGIHELYFTAMNTGNEATMGCEIYNNTPAQIAAADSEGDLNIIYSTRPLQGKKLCLESSPGPNNVSVVNYSQVGGTVSLSGQQLSLSNGVTQWLARFASDWTLMFTFTAPVKKLKMHLFIDEKFTEERLLTGQASVSVNMPMDAPYSYRVEIYPNE